MNVYIVKDTSNTHTFVHKTNYFLYKKAEIFDNLKIDHKEIFFAREFIQKATSFLSCHAMEIE